jgi:hypothetical protein
VVTDLKENEGDQIGPSSGRLCCYSPATQTNRSLSLTRASLQNRLLLSRAWSNAAPCHSASASTYHAKLPMQSSWVGAEALGVVLRPRRPTRPWFPPAGHFSWVKTPRCSCDPGSGTHPFPHTQASARPFVHRSMVHPPINLRKKKSPASSCI